MLIINMSRVIVHRNFLHPGDIIPTMEKYRPIPLEEFTPSFPNSVQLLVKEMKEMYDNPKDSYDLASMVRHDLNGTFPALAIACDMAKESDSRFELPPPLKTLEAIRKAGNLMEYSQSSFVEPKPKDDIYDESGSLDQYEIEPKIKEIIEKYLASSHFLEAVVQSAIFLSCIGRRADSLSPWQSLKELEIEFDDIINFLNLEELQLTNPLKLKGPEAIIAFNLLKNAKRHGQAIKVTTGKEDTCFSIQNESPHPLPEAVIKDPSRPYQKNSNDRFHYGLMITSFYAQAMGGQIIAESERLEGAENYLISFTYY